MSGKHWAGRVVAAVQILSWCAVSGLLLNKGLTNITNAAKEAEQGKEPRGMTSGLVMVATASFMLLVSPTILLIKFIDARRRRKSMQITEVDLPPSYEQAMESAPRYSTLFLDPGSEIHEQLLECQSTDSQPTIIQMNSDSREGFQVTKSYHSVDDCRLGNLTDVNLIMRALQSRIDQSQSNGNDDIK